MIRRAVYSFLFIMLSQVSWAEGNPLRQIVVQGEGVVQAAPDMAIVQVGVVKEARTAGEAMDRANRAAAAVLERIAETGIESRDVQTANISLHPRMQHSSGSAPRVVGYVASNNLSVRVRDLAVLGGLLDAVVGDGANSMNGLSFAIDDRGPLEDEARALAVADARAKAEILAEAAGVALGPIQSISEQGAGFQPQVFSRGAVAMEAMAAPVAEGELEIRSRVTMVFAIE